MPPFALPLKLPIQVLVVGVAATLLTACSVGSDVRPPQVAVEAVRPVGGGLFSQQVRLDLRVTNPNDFDLEVTGGRANLNVNGRPFANGVSNKQVTRMGRPGFKGVFRLLRYDRVDRRTGRSRDVRCADVRRTHGRFG